LRAGGKHENLGRMRRMLALAGLFLLLTGCGGADERAPFVESRIPPALGPGYWAPDGWAWGLIGLGEAPVQRYGVSSSATGPRANILILSGAGESAEAWFETARDLNARGYGVWVLERAGQGGSARYGSPRDLIHAPGFDDDVATTRLMARSITVASPDTPLIVLGSGVGGLVALQAMEGRMPADGLVLSSPDLKSNGALPGWQGWLATVGLGGLPQAFGQGWKREGPDAFKAGGTGDRQRGGVQLAWQTANPDLRMGGASLGWRAAFDRASKATFTDLGRVKTPILLLSPEQGVDRREGEDACRALPVCKRVTLKDGKPLLHLERKAVRDAWLSDIESFVKERAAARDATKYAPPAHQM
jgi:lysophospholipase